MTVRASATALLLSLAGLLACLLYAGPAAADVPSGFVDEREIQIERPTSMAFMPDGRMLVTTQPGLLQIFNPATGRKRTVLDLQRRVCSEAERGLLGVAVDPNFEANRYVYLYYTFKKHGECPTGQPTNPNNPVNRVARFVLQGGSATFDKILIDSIPSPNGNHNGGDLQFGKDRRLYVSVGDGGCDYAKQTRLCGGENNASRDKHVLLGKILRVTRNGKIPAGNPYANKDNGRRCGIPKANGRTRPGNVCKETFARGLRNPFRMAFDPDAVGTRFNVNDVGQQAWEEIDRGKKGADYAWNLCEGRHDNPARPGSVDCRAEPFTPPIHEYNHDATGCSSITGAAFVPDGAWPASYDDAYLFGDFVCGKIFKLTRKDRGGYRRTAFATNLGRGGPVAMTFGPDGKSLYYTTYAGGDGGQIRRITYSPTDRVSDAEAPADPDETLLAAGATSTAPPARTFRRTRSRRVPHPGRGRK